MMLAVLVAAAAVCPGPIEVPVSLKNGVWTLDVAGDRTVAEIAAFVSEHPGSEITVDSPSRDNGVYAVKAVSDAFWAHGQADLAIVLSSPRPENPLASEAIARIQVKCPTTKAD